MYAIRSYYEGVGAVLEQAEVSEITKKFISLVASNRRLFALAAIFVITSYSIHYTKLYESCSAWQKASSVAHQRTSAVRS